MEVIHLGKCLGRGGPFKKHLGRWLDVSSVYHIQSGQIWFLPPVVQVGNNTKIPVLILLSAEFETSDGYFMLHKNSAAHSFFWAIVKVNSWWKGSCDFMIISICCTVCLKTFKNCSFYLALCRRFMFRLAQRQVRVDFSFCLWVIMETTCSATTSWTGSSCGCVALRSAFGCFPAENVRLKATHVRRC